jgi:hypothetical protein
LIFLNLFSKRCRVWIAAYIRSKDALDCIVVSFSPLSLLRLAQELSDQGKTEIWEKMINPTQGIVVSEEAEQTSDVPEIV